MDLPMLRTDSYAKIFLYNTHESVACVPRHIIQMTEKVKPTLLQNAVERTLLRFPHMMLGIETTDTQVRYVPNVRPVVVLPFDGVSKRYTVGSKDTNGYLFVAGYEDDKIILEYQHSVSDGRGFEEFIKTVLLEYLSLSGKPVKNDGTVRGLDTRYSPEESTDGYKLLEDRDFSPEGIFKKEGSLHVENFAQRDDAPEIVTEITFSFHELRKATKEYGVSPLSIIAPLFARAYADKFGKDSKLPVIAEIPVDLRPIVPTTTTRYFICFIDLPYFREDDALPLPELFKKTKDFLVSQMEPEQLMYRAKVSADTCLQLHEAPIPLADKCARAQKVTTDFVLEDSYLITNVGEFKMPESCLPYIKGYGAILPCAVQPFSMLVSSFNGTMKLSVAQRDNDFTVCTTFIHELAKIGVHAESVSYPYTSTMYNCMDCK